MKIVSGLHITGRNGKVVFQFSQIIGFFPVLQVSQLKAESCFSITQIYQGEIRLIVDFYRLQAKCFFIEFKAFLKILNVEIKMVKCETIKESEKIVRLSFIDNL